MKKQQIIVLIALVSLSWYSCRKDKNETPAPVNQPPANSRIKTWGNANSVQSLEYNSAGNIVKYITAGKAIPDYTFDYNGNLIYAKRYNPNGSLSEDKTLTLNANGLVTEVFNTLTPSDLIKYEYDAEGHAVKQTNYNNGNVNTTTRLHYLNGNLVSDSTFSSSGTFSHARHYEYFTQVISTTEFPNFGEGFWGKGNKNALKKTTYINGNGTVAGTQVYMMPELDNLLRIKKTAYQSNGAGTPQYRDYTYY